MSVDRDLIPDPDVWAMYGITPMTLHRWTHDPHLGFPPIIKIRTRNYRSARALEAFKERMAAEGLRAARKAKRISADMHATKKAVRLWL